MSDARHVLRAAGADEFSRHFFAPVLAQTCQTAFEKTIKFSIGPLFCTSLAQTCQTAFE
jgi:hypothetical protein